VLVDGCRSDEDDARVVCNDLWVRDYLLDVGSVLVQRYVLLIGTFWQRGIVRSEEDDLLIDKSRARPKEHSTYQKPDLGLLRRGDYGRKHLQRVASVVSTDIALDIHAYSSRGSTHT
jgi:hypothetical protein